MMPTESCTWPLNVVEEFWHTTAFSARMTGSWSPQGDDGCWRARWCQRGCCLQRSRGWERWIHGGSDVVVVVYSVAISGVEEVPARSQHDTKICDEISEVRRTQIPSLVPSGRVVPFGLFDAEDLQSERLKGLMSRRGMIPCRR